MFAKLVSEQDKIIKIQQQLGEQVHTAVLSDIHVDHIVKDVCDSLLELLNANYIALFITEKSNSGYFKIKINYLGVDKKLSKLLEKAEQISGITRNELEIEINDNSVYKQFYESKEVLEINDNQSAIKYLKDKVSPEKGLRSMAPVIVKIFGNQLDYAYYVPMIAQDEMIGHLEIGRSLDNNFSEVEKTFLQSTALEMAVAIEYRRKQSKIETTSDMLNQIINGSDDQIYYKDTSNRFMYLNSAMALALGMQDPQQAIGKKESEILDQDYVLQREQHEQDVMASKQQKSYTDPSKIEEGVIKYFYRLIFPYYDSRGIFRGILGIDRDITDLQHNLNKIRLSEDWYQALFNSAKDGIVLLKGPILQDCNPKFLEMIDISREEAIGKSPFDFSPKYQQGNWESRGLGLRYISKALSGEPQTFNWIHLNKDGQELPTIVSLRRLTVNHRTFLVAIIQPLDDIKILKNELIDKTQEVDLFFNLSMDNLLIVDTEGKVERASPQWQRDLGYQEQEIIGKNIEELIHPEDVENTREAMIGLTEGKEALDFVNRYRAKDGSYHYLEWRSRSYHGKIYGAARDISERYQREAEIKASEIKYRQLFEQMLDAYAIHEIITNDRGEPIDYMFLEINPAFEQMTGLRAEQIVGRRVKEILPGTEDYWIKNYGKVALNNQKLKFSQYSQELKKYYQVSVFSPGKNKFATIFRNVTEDKQKEDQLTRALKKTEELDQLKTDFLNRMTHETRTPLSSVIGLTEILIDQEYDEEKVRHLNTILNSGKQLLSMMNNMLELASVEAGKVVIHSKKIILGKLLADIKKSYADSSKKNLTLELDIPSSLKDLAFTVDDVKLRQILIHLLNNAFKFSEQGVIKLGYYLKEAQLHLFVEDQGIGFTEESKINAFNDFEQGDGSTTREKGGTGIGLAIVRKYVELMGGVITLESAPGKGSRFDFTFKHEPISMEIKRVVDKQYDGHGHIILVAEDEAINYLMAEMTLKKYNYTVLRANNGQEALDIAGSRTDISAVMMDISMPVMDGFEAAAKIKQLNRSLPIFAVTAHSLSDIREKYAQAGFDDYIGKPFDKEKLLARLQAIADNTIELRAD